MNAMTKITQHQLNATDELTQLINELFALPVQDAVHISIDGDFLKVAIDGYGSTYVSLTCSSAAEIIKKSIKDLTDFWLVSGKPFWHCSAEQHTSHRRIRYTTLYRRSTSCLSYCKAIPS